MIYPTYRLFVLGLAVALGIGLWVLLRHTRLGITIRAGVDDRRMVAALGINVQVVFAIVFALGAALVGFSGVAGGSYLSLAPGEDGRYLLFSLIVVIVGGHGQRARRRDRRRARRPRGPVRRRLRADVLRAADLRADGAGARGPPAGAAREAGMSARLRDPRTLGLLALAAFLVAFPFFASTFWVVSIGIKTLWLGIAAISLIFLAGTVGMVSLAQTAIYGSAGYVLAHLTVMQGWNGWLAVPVAHRGGGRARGRSWR